jgi:hypothetical protein
MPAGALVTVPDPLPERRTQSLGGVDVPTEDPPPDPLPAEDGAKVAVTTVEPFIVTLQVPVPLQPPPLQPVNRDPEAARAVSVTRVPAV